MRLGSGLIVGLETSLPAKEVALKSPAGML